jgi:hypothetical protein
MIIMKYICSECDYETTTKCNFKKHTNSKNHITKINKNSFKCVYCEDQLENGIDLATHLNECNKNYVNYIAKLENKINELENKISIIIQNKNNISNYLLHNYKDAPCLSKLENYSILNKYEAKKTYKFGCDIISFYRQNILIKYLGKIIIKYYKTVEFDKRSFWISNLVHLSFYIKITENDKHNWIADRNAVKFIDIVINPLLNYIEQIITLCKNTLTTKIKNYNSGTTNNIVNKIEEFNIYLEQNREILDKIKNGYMAKKIVRYIAPDFYLERTFE